MRPRAGDPPRTMAQKILAGRALNEADQEVLSLKVDHAVLAADPVRTAKLLLQKGTTKARVETALAYSPACSFSAGLRVVGGDDLEPQLLKLGFNVGKVGHGFGPSVYLERFAAPARLLVTDDPRLALAGGAGVLTFVLSAPDLANAIHTGSFELRRPRVLSILLSGKLRPFVTVRDACLELVRRGLAESVRSFDQTNRTPVVIEFSGPGSRLLNVAERAVISSLATLVGAASALFLSDEKTESYLRDQRRSKAHRVLLSDQGAPYDHVMSLDLGTVDPLVMDETGNVRSARDVAGTPVSQVLLGGDGGMTIRDFLNVSALLKSKRVPASVDLLVAPSSRQVLEILAREGALADLIAVGARVVEPDRRVASGEVHPIPVGTVSVRTCDFTGLRGRYFLASADTCAHAVATGELGDPRAFKRPPKIAIPRVLPTEDVLMMRDGDLPAVSKNPPSNVTPPPAPKADATPATSPLSAQPTALDVLNTSASGQPSGVWLCDSLQEFRGVFDAFLNGSRFNAVVTTFAPTSLALALSRSGVFVFESTIENIRALRTGKTLNIAIDQANSTAKVTQGEANFDMIWREANTYKT